MPPSVAAIVKSQAGELLATELSVMDGSFGGSNGRSGAHGFAMLPLISLSASAAIRDDRTIIG